MVALRLARPRTLALKAVQRQTSASKATRPVISVQHVDGAVLGRLPMGPKLTRPPSRLAQTLKPSALRGQPPEGGATMAPESGTRRRRLRRRRRKRVEEAREGLDAMSVCGFGQSNCTLNYINC